MTISKLIEKIKSRYPKELNIEGLEPAFSQDLQEIRIKTIDECLEVVGLPFPEIGIAKSKATEKHLGRIEGINTERSRIIAALTKLKKLQDK